MEQRPITYNLLHKDELEYEVVIRGAQPADTVPALRAQVKNLCKDLPSDEIVSYDADVTAELAVVKNKLDELDDVIYISPPKSTPLKSLNRLQSVAHHLFHRITRLFSDDEDIASQIDASMARLDKILVKLDNIMHHFRSSLTQSQIAPDPWSDTQNLQNISHDSGSHVHKLNFRFNGKSCIKAFLQRLDELCLSRGLSHAKLFNSAAELFTDEALCWYRGIRDEVHNWLELRTLLLDEYLPSDYDHRLMQEIRARTQGSQESIINYLSIMQNYFTRLSKPVSDDEKLSIVLFNIRPFYTNQLALNPAESWTDLKRKCRLLEGAKERSQHFNEPPKATSSCMAPDLSYKSGGRPDVKVAALKPVANNFCVRCRIEGHTLRSCKAPFALVCYRCGAKDVTARSCTKCSSGVSSNSAVPKNCKQ
jgi:Retrotransposon gag protein